MENYKLTLPPDGEEKFLREIKIEGWADYRIASRITFELERVFDCQRIEGGGLIIKGYKAQT